MAEYIEREAAKRCVNEHYDDAIIMALDAIPAADVAPVRHGRWGKKNECSECGCQPWFERDIHTLNYCPNCGAKMEVEE